MNFAFGETVVVIRGPGNDKYGNPLPGEPEEIPIEGCAVWTGQMVNAEQVLVDREPMQADRVVSFPAGSDVRHTDQLRIRGKVYDVVGDPFEYRNPFTGTDFGVLAYANRGEG